MHGGFHRRPSRLISGDSPHQIVFYLGFPFHGLGTVYRRDNPLKLIAAQFNETTLIDGGKTYTACFYPYEIFVFIGSIPSSGYCIFTVFAVIARNFNQVLNFRVHGL